MNAYPTRRLGDICVVAIGRQRSPRNAAGSHMVRYLRAANVKDGRLLLDDVLMMNFTPGEQQTYRLLPGDVLVTEGCGSPSELGASASWTGQIAGIVCFQNTLLRLRSKEGLTDPRYLLHLARWCHRTGRWLEASSGVSILHIGHGRAKRVEVPCPVLPIQKQIGAILSAYDDLIENNTRRIQILEEMAQAIYREWFVEFRFPGHEGVQMVESELGPIPEGWRVQRLGEVVAVNARTIRVGDEMPDINYIDISAVSQGEFGWKHLEYEKAPGRARRLVAPCDVIWSTVRPNLRAYALVCEPPPNCVASTGFAVLTAHSIPWSYLYSSTTAEAFVSYLVNHATGAAYPAVTGRTFEEVLVIVPDRSSLTRFHHIVGPMYQLIAMLRAKSKSLSATRDLLLPRLISGEIDVSNLDIGDAEPAA